MIRTATVSVGTTATDLLADLADSGRPRPGVTRRVTLKNTTAADLFLGGSDVTTANGLAVASGATLTLDLAHDDALYGVAAVAASVNVFASGL
jgi:hypothetical protein